MFHNRESWTLNNDIIGGLKSELGVTQLTENVKKNCGKQE